MRAEDDIENQSQEEDPSDTYFAALQNKERYASEIMERVDRYYDQIHHRGLEAVWAKAFRAYYGLDESGSYHKSSMVTFGGDQGELTLIKANHLRNIVQHLRVMTTQNRPHFEARAVNTDSKSQDQVHVAQGVLEYYMREGRIEDRLESAVEMGLIFGEGFVRVTWDPGADNGSGDLAVETLAPLDVIRDWRRPSHDVDWYITRETKNKYDLIARYPDKREKILGIDPFKHSPKFARDTGPGADETDDIPVYQFYHKRSDAVPGGRLTILLSDDCILFDGPLPYKSVPIFRLAPGEFIGSGFGYTGTWDLLSLQQVLDAMVSAINTNFDAYGVQNVVMEDGTDIGEEELSGGLRVWKIQRGAQAPAGINLTRLPDGWQAFIQLIVGWMEIISGVNSVTRGEPQSSLKSGAALALVQAQAIQFNSGLQKSFIRLLEDVGTGVINVLKEYAEAPRVAMIVGIDQRYQIKSFTKEDLARVERVFVDAGNPMSRTIAGRVQLAETMLERGLIKTPEEYFTVFTTGRLDAMYKGDVAQMQRIKVENERLAGGPPVVQVPVKDGGTRGVAQGVSCFPIHQHSLHIREHMTVIVTAESTDDPNVVAAVMAHIDDHLWQLKNTPPEVLRMIGEEPPGMPEGPGRPPGKGPSGPPASAGPPMKGPGGPGAPAPMPNLPKNPLTGEVANVPPPPGVGIPDNSVPGV